MITAMFVYYLLMMVYLELENRRRLALKVSLPSFCRAHHNEAVWMYPMLSLRTLTKTFVAKAMISTVNGRRANDQGSPW